MLARLKGAPTAGEDGQSPDRSDTEGRGVNVARLLHQAKADLAAGRALRAFRRTQEALEADPAFAGLAYVQGLCLSQLARHEEALEAFRAELTRDPNHSDARRQFEHLQQAFQTASPPSPRSGQRNWNTSLPLRTLLALQRCLHNYRYRGVPMLKNPFDLALYPMLLWQAQPRTVIEIGSKSGGSALWLGDQLNSFGIDGHVYSIDIVKVEEVSHPRVTFLEGDGRALASTLRETWLATLPRPWLVIEDADHAYETSIATLRFFDPWLRPVEYIVVEDGIITDLDDAGGALSGPHRAVQEFLAARPGAYEIDARYCDFFGYNVTWCTNGFLRKSADAPPPTTASAPATAAPAPRPSS
jgi:cephalosporin hydroxylase